MTRTFCTLFDSRYLSRGVAMLESLRAHCRDCRVVVFAFDQVTKTLLERLALPGVETVGLEDFEDAELRRVRPERTTAEYMWTCTPSTVLFAIERLGCDECTYLDADLYFFNSPVPLFEEMGDDSVLITPHNYYWLYDQSHRSGIFCVQFVTFRNNHDGLTALHWWRRACIEWCHARVEPGRFGDQKYLDDWPERFAGVHVLAHRGGGVAPWNIQRYRVHLSASGIQVVDSTRSESLIFFHFHGLKLMRGGLIDFGWYPLSHEAHRLLYAPYLRHLGAIAARVGAIHPEYRLYDLPPAGILSLGGMKRMLGFNIACQKRYLESGR